LKNFSFFSSNEYSLYNQYKYLYLEGNFEDTSLKLNGIRSDFMFKYPYGYFKKSKHIDLNEFSNLIYFLPFEFNKHYSNFQLQTNDYIQASFFRENYSCINECMDASLIEGKDTGKKLTAVFVLFPEDLELSRRKLNFRIKYQQGEDKKWTDLELSNPMSCVIFKSRKFIYEVQKNDFPFILVFYYIHGPMDKNNFSA
jgi:hypothetical protein